MRASKRQINLCAILLCKPAALSCAVSEVSRKDQGEEQVRKALRALIHHIKAQFPDTFEAKLREFGFQKESY
ncbi:hypothetical protein [Hymenobacter cellulosilyticus]|uniref:Uncharacterized protein n=1 Tax=Hymenobacter cellulosilyticus TaxID=2932248 RepID=A0A8T9Q6K3_9BACT|nr:hypothetical protein [Hymenobacter cellulosilyticus]UOQ73194.1 hypothetical protein MUN79_04275 [Hymenobacter cellulosilyticus]